MTPEGAAESGRIARENERGGSASVAGQIPPPPHPPPVVDGQGNLVIDYGPGRGGVQIFDPVSRRQLVGTDEGGNYSVTPGGLRVYDRGEGATETVDPDDGDRVVETLDVNGIRTRFAPNGVVTRTDPLGRRVEPDGWGNLIHYGADGSSETTHGTEGRVLARTDTEGVTRNIDSQGLVRSLTGAEGNAIIPPPHEVAPGDDWWHIAADHLRYKNEREPTNQEVVDEVNRLHAINQAESARGNPRTQPLGRPADLIRPGEVILLEAPPLDEPSPPSEPRVRAGAPQLGGGELDQGQADDAGEASAGPRIGPEHCDRPVFAAAAGFRCVAPAPASIPSPEADGVAPFRPIGGLRSRVDNFAKGVLREAKSLEEAADALESGTVPTGSRARQIAEQGTDPAALRQRAAELRQRFEPVKRVTSLGAKSPPPGSVSFGVNIALNRWVEGDAWPEAVMRGGAQAAGSTMGSAAGLALGAAACSVMTLGAGTVPCILVTGALALGGGYAGSWAGDEAYMAVDPYLPGDGPPPEAGPPASGPPHDVGR